MRKQSSSQKYHQKEVKVPQQCTATVRQLFSNHGNVLLSRWSRQTWQFTMTLTGSRARIAFACYFDVVHNEHRNLELLFLAVIKSLQNGKLERFVTILFSTTARVPAWITGLVLFFFQSSFACIGCLAQLAATHPVARSILFFPGHSAVFVFVWPHVAMLADTVIKPAQSSATISAGNVRRFPKAREKTKEHFAEQSRRT